MIKPLEEEFIRLSANYNLIPVYQTVPADLETPVSIYLRGTGAEAGSFLLESGDLGEKARYSFIGLSPFISLYTEQDYTVTAYYSEEGKVAKKEIDRKDPLDVLQRLFKKFRVYQPPEIPGFRGGAVGYLSYDMVKYWEKIPQGESREKYPRCYFNFPRLMAVYDHRRHLLTAVCFIGLDAGSNIEGKVEDKKNDVISKMLLYEKAKRDLKNFLGKLKKSKITPKVNDKTTFVKMNENISDGEFEKKDFIKAIEDAKEYIKSGDIFQVVLSRRIKKELKVHPFSLYRALRSLNPSPYQFYLSFEGFQVLGASPEILVSLKNGIASTKPIAGTRPRGIDETADMNLARELSCDEKERSEHMMLVDLGRNDLGKVCEYGSVKVDKLLNVEYFSHVIHLTSEVTGLISKKYGFADLLKAAFPAGTVSGAPKIRAMEIIAETEPVSRGPYAGAVGYVGFDGDMDTCIAIRTIITGDGFASLQAGAGIVADSIPHKEFEETEHKMAASLKAIKLAEEWEKDDINS